MIFITRNAARWAALCAALLAADWFSKVWVLKKLAPLGSVPVTRFFHLTYVENTGAAFGMLTGHNWVFVPVALGLLGLMYFWRGYLAEHGPAAVAGAVLICVGALGNLYDRLVYGFVVDFLDFRIWPVFNLADSYISVGGTLLGWAFYFRSPDGKKKAAPTGGSAAEA